MPQIVLISESDTDTFGIYDADGNIRIVTDNSSGKGIYCLTNGAFRGTEVAENSRYFYSADGSLNYYFDSNGDIQIIGHFMGAGGEFPIINYDFLVGKQSNGTYQTLHGQISSGVYSPLVGKEA